jgi:hypothetical protein
MIRFLKRHLLENRTDPNGGHTEAFKVSQFARQSAYVSPAKPLPRFPPGGFICLAPIVGLKDRSGASPDSPPVIASIALFVSIRKTVEQ